jgi:hypothetical protein
MKTVAENSLLQAESLKSTIKVLLQHSSLHRVNHPGSMVFSLDGNFGWNDLSVHGQQAQAKALQEYRHLFAIVSCLLIGQPQSTLKVFEDNDRLIIKLLEQHTLTCFETREQAQGSLSHAIDNIITLVANLSRESQDHPIYLPDTNALLANPDLEHWRFPNVSQFNIGLLPTVLSELDKLKLHKVDSVKKKSEGLIKRIKGYRARGRLSDGVPLTKNISTLRTFATEPNLDRSLPWLDKHNNDDRILASVLEVMRVEEKGSGSFLLNKSSQEPFRGAVPLTLVAIPR